MSRKAQKNDSVDLRASASDGLAERGHWLEEIAAAGKRFQVFQSDGDVINSRYRLEDNQGKHAYRERYNILYSSTETIKPSLFTRTPKIEATQRHKDRSSFKVTAGTLIMEAATQYALEEMDFDTPVKAAISDFLLPGMGQVWVRYEPTIEDYADTSGAVQSKVIKEGLSLDYVHRKDVLYGEGRIWPEVPWVARRTYLSKKKAIARFGKQKADRLQYSQRRGGSDADSRGIHDIRDRAIVWELWDKDERKVIWVSPDYPDGVLDSKSDPLHLKDFFPCPQPIRAVHDTSSFVPRAFYSQYKAQAEELDELTARIRHLTKAIKVIGIYDSTQDTLSRLLAGGDNRMVPVENWAAFAQSGGIAGAVQWVPIKEIATVLGELYKQREIAKAEIYEITGFSDIVRGVTKASETLGAQQIKNEWAGGRLRSIQTDVQNFIRDIIRIISEVIVEHFNEDTIAQYAGFEPPEVTPEEQQAIQAHAAQALVDPVSAQQPLPPTNRQLAIQQFLEVVKFLRDEKQRCALIGIETDSTIQPDEAQERKDRLEFLGQIGAFLQQAGPMALQYPDMRGLLGSLMMFAVHTFRSSRAVEKEFEQFTKQLEQQPPMPAKGQEGEGGDNGQAALQTAQIKSETDKAIAASSAQAKVAEVQAKQALDQQRLKQDHDYNMAQVALKDRELDIRDRELDIREAEVDIKVKVEQANAAREDRALEHQEAADLDDADRQDRQFDASKAAEAEAREADAGKPDKGD